MTVSEQTGDGMKSHHMWLCCTAPHWRVLKMLKVCMDSKREVGQVHRRQICWAWQKSYNAFLVYRISWIAHCWRPEKEYRKIPVFWEVAFGPSAEAGYWRGWTFVVTQYSHLFKTLGEEGMSMFENAVQCSHDNKHVGVTEM